MRHISSSTGPSGFTHPFDLSPVEFLKTDRYGELVAETRKLRPDSIPWYPRDWGRIVWPPASGDHEERR